MSETTQFTSNHRSISAELFRPASGRANGGVIVVAHGTDELRDPWGADIRAYADALTEIGFITLIPHYLLSTGTAPGFRDLEAIILNRDTWQRALADAVAHAVALPDCDPSRVGLLGFSLGGHLCLRARAMSKVLVEFFGPALDLGQAGTRRLCVQIHHGLDDSVVPFDPNYAIVTGTLRSEGAVCDGHTYPGAGHGFIGADPYNTAARKHSRELTLAFFKEHL